MRSIPAFMVVDRGGVVRHAEFGLFDAPEAELVAAIEPLLGEGAAGG